MNRFALSSLVLVLVGCASAVVPVAVAGTFYVSPNGNDRAGGHSPAHAWRTIGRVNEARLRPGDTVLFRGGSTFTDNTLTPPASGTAARPIRFASYGKGRAVISNGRGAVWFASKSHLVFERLQLTTGNADAVIFAGSSGESSDIVIRRCALFDSNFAAINQPSPDDANWLIRNSTISHVGDSGLILLGHGDVVKGNLIADVGWNTALDYAKHGVYVKGPNNAIVGNRISGFGDGSGVTLRYRGSRVVGNTITNGQTAVSFYREDSRTGASVIKKNQTSGITGAGFYYDIGGGENFIVSGNTFGMVGGTGIDLAGQPARQIVVSGNRVLGSFEWALSARFDAAVPYSEFGNGFTGRPMFAWGGRALTYLQYRQRSGQGSGDRVGLP